MAVSTNAPSYACEMCHQVFSSIYKFVSHKQSHTIANRCWFSCNRCLWQFPQRSDLIRDQQVHTNEHPFNCGICGSLAAHKRSHIGDRPYTCETCGLSFVYQWKLKQHIGHHSGDKPYECDFCGRKFWQNWLLLGHKRTHTGERPYKCKACGMCFAQNSVLFLHLRTHTGQRPFACEVCGKAFPKKDNLTKHLRTHSRERPYACDICGKSFAENGTLGVHKSTHSTDRPFMCEQCGKTFAHKKYLLQHKRYVHDAPSLDREKVENFDMGTGSDLIFNDHKSLHVVHCTLTGADSSSPGRQSCLDAGSSTCTSASQNLGTTPCEQGSFRTGMTKREVFKELKTSATAISTDHDSESDTMNGGCQSAGPRGEAGAGHVSLSVLTQLESTSCTVTHTPANFSQNLQETEKLRDHPKSSQHRTVCCLHQSTCDTTYNKSTVDNVCSSSFTETKLAKQTQNSADHNKVCCMPLHKIIQMSDAEMTSARLGSPSQGRQPMDKHGQMLLQTSSITHHQHVHRGAKFECDVCGKHYSLHKSLLEHKRTHTGERPYQCSVCGLTFTKTGKFAQHRRTHMGEKKYQCDQCGKKFTYRENLIRHTRMHSGERPFKCDQCEQAFSLKSTLTRHCRRHTGERPYMCDICGKTFIQREGLGAHKRIHSGVKPYRCEKCGRAFTERGHLRYHLRTHIIQQEDMVQ